MFANRYNFVHHCAGSTNIGDAKLLRHGTTFRMEVSLLHELVEKIHETEATPTEAYERSIADGNA